jgi:hypothetical protein
MLLSMDCSSLKKKEGRKEREKERRKGIQRKKEAPVSFSLF